MVRKEPSVEAKHSQTKCHIFHVFKGRINIFIVVFTYIKFRFVQQTDATSKFSSSRVMNKLVTQRCKFRWGNSIVSFQPGFCDGQNIDVRFKNFENIHGFITYRTSIEKVPRRDLAVARKTVE